MTVVFAGLGATVTVVFAGFVVFVVVGVVVVVVVVAGLLITFKKYYSKIKTFYF